MNIFPHSIDMNKIKKSKYFPWIILVVVFFASIAAPLNQFKVPPIMPFLIEAFQIDLSSAGMLMSVFAITGVFLALPAGFILQQLGLKTTGLIALGSLIIGAIIGANSLSSSILLTSRIIEGIGMGFMTVLAPAAIALWFSPEKRGLPMGIWATWVPVGTLIMLILAPKLAESNGWELVWWISASFSIVMFFLYALFISNPEESDNSHNKNDSEAQSSENINIWNGIKNRDIWLMAIVFMLFAFNGLGWSSFYPTFLASERGFSLSQASLTFSLSTVMSIVSCLITGVISDRIGSRSLFFTLPAIPLAFLPTLLYLADEIWIPILLMSYGLFVGTIPTAIFSAVPEVMGNPKSAGLGLAIITLGQNLGFVLGPAVFGLLVSRLNWTLASFCLIPIMLFVLFFGSKVDVK
jgi:MFS family permease